MRILTRLYVVALRMHGDSENPHGPGGATTALLEAPPARGAPAPLPAAPDDAPSWPADTLLDSLPYAVVQVSEELLVAAANEEASRLLGLLPSLSGAPLPEPWPEFSLRRFARRLCAQRAAPVQARAQLEGGRVLELTGLPRSIGALLVIRDVSEQARGDQADRAFVANAAHELRASLGGIASGVEALELGAKEHPSERDRLLGCIATEVRTLRREVEALLVLSRAHAEPRALVLDAVALTPLVHEVAESLSVHSGVEVQTTCDRGVSARALRPLLEIALRNVARNAAYHTRRGTVRLSCLRVADLAALEVADDGPGIAPELRERLFERFSGESIGDGVGIGLPLAREIARLLDGDLEVLTSDSGTTVRVLLPSA